MNRDLVRVSRGLFLNPADAADAGDACRRISILNARGQKVGYHQWDPLGMHHLIITGKRTPVATAIAVDRAIGAMHRWARMVASADSCLCAADRCKGDLAAGVLATAALDVAGREGFPADTAQAVRERVLGLCAAWPHASWAMRLLARVSREAA